MSTKEARLDCILGLTDVFSAMDLVELGRELDKKERRVTHGQSQQPFGNMNDSGVFCFTGSYPT